MRGDRRDSAAGRRVAAPFGSCNHRVPRLPVPPECPARLARLGARIVTSSRAASSRDSQPTPLNVGPHPRQLLHSPRLRRRSQSAAATAWCGTLCCWAVLSRDQLDGDRSTASAGLTSAQASDRPSRLSINHVDRLPEHRIQGRRPPTWPVQLQRAHAYPVTLPGTVPPRASASHFRWPHHRASARAQPRLGLDHESLRG